MKLVVCMLLASVLCGCGALRPLTAADADMRDYEDYALGGDWHAHLAEKLALAQKYLDRHPDGAWADDVRAQFELGEAKLNERAKEDREVAMTYLTYLPNGPHSKQLVFVVNAFDDKRESTDERSARLTEKDLAEAANERDAAKDWITSAIAAAINDVGSGYDLGVSVVKLVIGDAAPTWGERWVRARDLDYVIPGKRTRDPRSLATKLSLRVVDGIIVGVTLKGPDLFVRWAELDAMRAMDEASGKDRDAARTHVHEVLTGMLEARLPPTPEDPTTSMISRNNGAESFVATMGSHAGEDDTIAVISAKSAAR